MICKKCNKNLPITEFKVKKNGKMNKWCLNDTRMYREYYYKRLKEQRYLEREIEEDRKLDNWYRENELVQKFLN